MGKRVRLSSRLSYWSCEVAKIQNGIVCLQFRYSNVGEACVVHVARKHNLLTQLNICCLILGRGGSASSRDIRYLSAHIYGDRQVKLRALHCVSFSSSKRDISSYSFTLHRTNVETSPCEHAFLHNVDSSHCYSREMQRNAQDSSLEKLKIFSIIGYNDKYVTLMYTYIHTMLAPSSIFLTLLQSP